MKKLILSLMVITIIGCKKEAGLVKYNCHCTVDSTTITIRSNSNDFFAKNLYEAKALCSQDTSYITSQYDTNIYHINCHL